MARRSIAEPGQAALLVAATLLLGSCGGGGKSPSSPGAGPPVSGVAPQPGAIRVTGTERLAWTQAGDASDLRFRAYVDDAPVDVDSAMCTASPDPDCSAPLPPLTDGIHTIAMTAVSSVGAESDSSAPLTVQKVSSTAGTVAPTLKPGATAHSAAPADGNVPSFDGQQFSVDTIAGSLRPPLQLAATPDGRLLVSEGDGRVSVLFPDEPDRNRLAIDTTQVFDATASGAIGLAVHPEFASNHLVYLSLVSSDRIGARLRIVRLREVGGLLGEPATVFEAPVVKASGTLSVGEEPLPASAASARMAFGPDGLLYALLSPGIAFDREPAASTPFASIIRIGADGRASSAGALDGVATTPLGLAWHPVTGELLAIFPSTSGAVEIASVARGNLAGIRATDAVDQDERVGGSWSAGRLRFDFANTTALLLGRAFVEELRQSRSVAARLAVPVAIDGLFGSLSGEVIDAVAVAGTAYLAVTVSSTPVQSDDRGAHVLRLRPR